MNTQTLNETLQQSFTGVVDAIVSFLPNLAIAFLLILAGWLSGYAVSKIVTQIIRLTKITELLKNTGFKDVFNRLGLSFKPELFIGSLVKWFIFIIFLITAFDVLGLSQVNDFLKILAGYIPNIIGAVLILITSGIIAEFLKKLVVGSARAANVDFAGVLGSFVKWFILVIAILTALFELGIAATFIQTVFTGFIVSLALAIGISFGVGGHPHVNQFIGDIKKKFKKENIKEHYVDNSEEDIDLEI
jgi:hypothetical protein